MKPAYALGVLLTVISATAFGSMPIFARYAYAGGATVTALLFVRFGIGTLIFWTYLTATRTPAWPRGWWRLWLLGGLVYTLQSSLYFGAVRYIDASLAALILYVYPAIVVMLALLLEREAIGARTQIGLLASFAGLALVLGVTGATLSLKGALMALAAAFVYSGYIFWGSRILREAQAVVATTHVATSATLSLGLLGLATGQLNVARFTPAAWMASLGVGVVATVFAIFFFFAGMQRIGATRASIVSMLEPLVTTGLAAMLFAERLTPLQSAGGALVLLGGWLAVQRGTTAVADA